MNHIYDEVFFNIRIRIVFQFFRLVAFIKRVKLDEKEYK